MESRQHGFSVDCQRQLCGCPRCARIMHCPDAVAPNPQDLPSFAFNVTLMAREGLTGGTQLMAATVSVSNMVPRLFCFRNGL